MEAYRTPDDRFEGLPDFPFAPCYREASGLRLAHLDEGDGAPVVFFHGEPTWSYLWRKVFPPLRDAGFRVRHLPGYGPRPFPPGLFGFVARKPGRPPGGAGD